MARAARSRRLPRFAESAPGVPGELDRGHPLPLYAQVREVLETELALGLSGGLLKPGDFFTTERALCRRFGISAITAKRTLDELESAGRVSRQRGRGTMVAQPRISQTLDHFYRFTTHIASQGLVPSWRNLRVGVARPSRDVARVLGLGAREAVVELRRLRLVDGEPFFLHSSFLPQRLFPGLERYDHEHRSVYDILAREYHRPPVRCRETFEPVLLHQEEARLLGVHPRSAGMRLERLTRSADGAAIEYSRGVLRGDRCRLTVDLN